MLSTDHGRVKEWTPWTDIVQNGPDLWTQTRSRECYNPWSPLNDGILCQPINILSETKYWTLHNDCKNGRTLAPDRENYYKVLKTNHTENLIDSIKYIKCDSVDGGWTDYYLDEDCQHGYTQCKKYGRKLPGL